MTLNACQAVASTPPAEYQGEAQTEQAEAATAPTSSPEPVLGSAGEARLTWSGSVSLGSNFLLHGQVSADRDPSAGDQTQEETDLAVEIAGRLEHLVQDQGVPTPASIAVAIGARGAASPPPPRSARAGGTRATRMTISR